MSKADQFKNQIKKKRPSALSNYIGETHNQNSNEVKDIDNKNINDQNENNITNETYVNNDNNNINTNDVVVNDYEEYLKELLQGKNPKKKKIKKVFTSFYMDPDLAREVDKISKKGEKGDKSKLINTAIRKLLKEYGLVE